MKKIISAKQALIILSFWSILFLCLSMIALGLEVFGFVEEKGAGLFAFGIFLGLTILFLWALNRLACVVWIEDGIVKRKGLFCGFYKECPLESIKTVKIERAWHEGDFIYLVDNHSPHTFNRIRSDSYICFRKTKTNLDWLQSVWQKSIQK